MSKLSKFTATEQTTAVPACQAMLWWGSQFGLPEWLISDGDTHFANEAMELFKEKMKVKHHITLAFCPWANGSIEPSAIQVYHSLFVIAYWGFIVRSNFDIERAFTFHSGKFSLKM